MYSDITAVVIVGPIGQNITGKANNRD